MKKKILSILLVAAMCISVCCISFVPASAATKTYENCWEQSMSGATAWVTCAESLKASASTSAKTVVSIPVPTGGTNVKQIKIISNYVWKDSKYSWIKARYNGKDGYIRTNYVLINLPDVLPNIQYNITNSYSSIFKFKDSNLTNVTGNDLYDFPNDKGKVSNPRSSSGGSEYIAPMSYRTAVKVAEAQQRAVKYNYTLKIYDTYRPAYASNKVVTAYKKYSGKNGYSTNFIADPSVSKHTVGCALDCTLVNLNTGANVRMPSNMHDLSTNAQGTVTNYHTSMMQDPYKYPYKYSVSDPNGSIRTYNANRLWYIMTNNKVNAGNGCLQTINAEWWHFEDLSSTYSAKTGNQTTVYEDMKANFTNYKGNSKGTCNKDTCQRFTTICSSVWLKVSKNSVSLDAPSGSTKAGTYTLTVKTNSGSTVTYSSSNTKVAKVNSNGKITAVGSGSCEIVVKNDKGDKTSCLVTVK